MELFAGWLEANWFNLVQTASIVCGLVFTGLSLRRDVRSRRLANLLALKEEHRELWNTIHSDPGLSRVLRADVDLAGAPVTVAEEVFLRQLIVHAATAWELAKDGTPLNLKALRKDVAAIFSLPIPSRAWENAREFQDPAFRRFVESAKCRAKPVRKSAS